MARRTDQDVLLERIPAVPDMQAAWLLLSHCASARANFVLRTVRPELAREFCVSHDAAMWEVPHDDSRSAGVTRPRVDVQNGVTPSLSRGPRSAEHSKDTHRRVLGQLGRWVGDGPNAILMLHN